VTLWWVPDDTYNYINALRTTHYPPELLFNPAHVGLFTRVTVPSDLLNQVRADVSQIAGECTPFRFEFGTSACLWGKCVVLPIVSHIVDVVRSRLNARWMSSDIVDRSERKSYQPHVTIHARVSKARARSVFQSIRQTITERVSNGRLQGQAIGIQLWEYNEGQPWRHIVSVPFAQN